MDRKEPELGDMVNESVHPAVAPDGAYVLGLVPQPLARIPQSVYEKTASQP